MSAVFGAQVKGINRWRQEILTGSLRVLTVFGAVAAAAGTYYVATGAYATTLLPGWVVIASYWIGYASVVIAALALGLHYTFRAGIVITVTLLLGIQELLLTRFTPVAALLLASSALFATILLGPRLGTLVVAVGTTTILARVWPATASDMGGVAVFLLLSASSSSAVSHLVSRMRHAIDTEHLANVEQSRTNRELLAHQVRYQLAARVGQVAVWELDWSTGLVSVDPHLASLLALDRASAVTLDTLLSRIDPSDEQFVRAWFESNRVGSDSVGQLTFRLRAAGGGARWFTIAAATLEDIGTSSRLTGTWTEITDRRYAEQASDFLSDALAAASNRRLLLEKCVAHLLSVFAADEATVWLHDHGAIILGYSSNASLDGRPAELLHGDLTKDPWSLLRAQPPRLLRREGQDLAGRLLTSGTMSTSLVLPLVSEQTLQGAAVLGWQESRSPLSTWEQKQAEGLASRIALSLSRARLLLERERVQRRQSTLSEIARIALDTLGTAPPLEAIVVALAPDHAHIASVALVDERRRVTRIASASGSTAGTSLSYEGPAIDLAADHPLAEALQLGRSRVLSSERPLFDGRAVPSGPWIDLWQREACHHAVVVPIDARDRRFGGLLLANAGGDRPFSDDDVAFAEEVAVRIALALVNNSLYQQARDARLVAEQANLAKSEFLSRVSHELRTPLNAILGFAQLLEFDIVDSEQSDSVTQILRGGRHLLDLVNEVIDLARAETGRLSLSPEPTDLADVVDECVTLVQPLAEGHNLSIDRQNDPDAPTSVLADRRRLKQVLLNLLGNAIKFNTPGGSVRVHIATGEAGRARLAVIDTGPGLSREQQGRLFFPFERLGAQEQNIEGSGLGLALSRGIVQAMGGTIGVISDEGHGSTFWFELPIAQMPSSAVVPSEQPPVTADGDTTTGTLVLYIEDNRTNARLVERALSQRGNLHCVSTEHGLTGYALARELRPALILLDLHLPDLHGAEVLERLRDDQLTHHIPVVVLTADASRSEEERLRLLGAVDYLTKPLDLVAFMRVVDRLLHEPPN